MKGVMIGKLFDLDCSTISVGRKKLKGKMKKDKNLKDLFDKINKDLTLFAFIFIIAINPRQINPHQYLPNECRYLHQ